LPSRLKDYHFLLKRNEVQRLRSRWSPVFFVLLAVYLIAADCWEASAARSECFVGVPSLLGKGRAVRLLHALDDAQIRLEASQGGGEEDEEEEGIYTGEKDFLSVWLFLTLASSIGLFLGIPKVIAAAAGIKGQNMEENLRSLGLNTLVSSFFAFATKLDFDEWAQKNKNAVVAALGRLAVSVQAPPLSNTTIALGELGSSASDSWTTYLCIGNADFCRSCVTSAKGSAAGMEQEHVYLVALPVTAELLPDETALAVLREFADGASHVALPEVSEGTYDIWSEFCKNESERLPEQGFSLSEGVGVVLNNTGKVQRRFLGAPDWPAALVPASSD